MVVGCIVDLFANRKLRHRKLLLESSMLNLDPVVNACVNLRCRSKPGSASYAKIRKHYRRDWLDYALFGAPLAGMGEAKIRLFSDESGAWHWDVLLVGEESVRCRGPRAHEA